MNVDFYRNPGEGQMMPIEREVMYKIVVDNKCKCLLEIGTWRGGGSTYILSSAAKETKGVLHTIESDFIAQRYAIDLYDTVLKDLRPFVEFYLGKSVDVLPCLLNKVQFDFVLFDGENNSKQTLFEFLAITPELKTGGIVACHDWNIEKSSDIKPLLEDVGSFQKLIEITNTPTGFAAFRKIS